MIKASLIDHMGSDLNVVNAARVSFGKRSSMEEEHGFWKLKPSDVKLIKYLADHKHYSPFGHCFASFHIKAPIFVARQLVKHEYLRWNEVSRRYVEDEPEFYVPETFRNAPVGSIKQGSSGVHYDSSEWVSAADDVYSFTKTIYANMLADGVAPEQARMVLPQSTMTEWYWSGSLDAFANMCVLRLKEDTQYETRLVAQQIDKQMYGIYPHSWEALVKGRE